MFDLINKFDRVFCIFTGNSINDISQKHWDFLKKECTIGINHSFKIFSPTYLFFADKDVMYSYWQWYKNKKIKPITYARDRSKYKKINIERYPELIPSDWYDSYIDEWWSEKDTLIYKQRPKGVNMNITPMWLLSTLYEKEYKGKVYLLGADFYVNEENGEKKYHFQNYLNNYYKKRKLDKKLQEFKEYFEHPYWDGKLNIYNCNPKSTLEKFLKVNLGDILNG